MLEIFSRLLNTVDNSPKTQDSGFGCRLARLGRFAAERQYGDSQAERHLSHGRHS